MAKYDVTHSCGHRDEKVLFGPHKERERKLAWYESTPCSECYRAEREAHHKAQNEHAAALNRSAGLPALEGTERQIAWAESIRKTGMGGLGEAIEDLTKRLPEWMSEEARADLKQGMAALEAALLAEPSASWWIDHRAEVERWDDRFVILQVRNRGLAPIAKAEADAHYPKQEQE